MPNGSRKGSAYERQICEMLSLWWSGGEKTDIFWRTGGSGGRAKSRGRKGKATYGQHGDICATDPIADPLIKALTIELKRGYPKCNIMALLDKPKYAAKQEWEKWFDQASESSKLAGSLSWMIIHKKDRRRAIVYFPNPLLVELQFRKCFGSSRIYPSATVFTKVSGTRMLVHCMRLSTFLNHVTPDQICLIAENL